MALYNVVDIHKEQGYVDKRYSSRMKYRNEVKWLKLLEDFERSPKLLFHDDQELMTRTTYVGEKATQSNVPEDWPHQCLFLLKELKRFNCAHNDFRENVTVMDGKLHLIDFEHSHYFNQKHAHNSELALLSAVLWKSGEDIPIGSFCQFYIDHFDSAKKDIKMI